MRALASRKDDAAERSPDTTEPYSRRMSQYNVPPADTGSLGNRLTSCSSMPDAVTRAAMTRPADAPRSTAATTRSFTPGSSQEGGRYSGIDGDEQAGGERQIAAAEREDRGCHVLGQHLALEQSPPGVELA